MGAPASAMERVPSGEFKSSASFYLGAPSAQNSREGTAAEEPEPAYVTHAVATGPPCYRKHVVLVCHGESDGQTAKSRGLPRSHESLLDCGLTRKGWTQAYSLNKTWLQRSVGEPPI